MKRSDIICKILINNGLAETEFQAQSMFSQTFTENFRKWSLSSWDKEVSDLIAQEFINAIGKSPHVAIHYLIEDLHQFVNNQK
jgi:hypothetical protein